MGLGLVQNLSDKRIRTYTVRTQQESMSYHNPNTEQEISTDELSASDPDTQSAVMEAWFRSRFEDPAERTPYQSAEGGYIWIWGGPYDAHEQLANEFSGSVPQKIIEALADDLTQECWQWAPTPSSDDYDDYLVDDIARITSYHHTFSGAILDVASLLKTEVPEPVAICFYRMLHVNVITAMETYLSDAFINMIANHDELMRKFVESTPEFKSEKIPLADAYKAIEQVERKAKSYLADVVWHHIDRVKLMYKATLDIDFPANTGPIFRAVHTRHDIVHRNGKTKDGEEILVTRDQVSNLIEQVEALVAHIDAQVADLRRNQENSNVDANIAL